MCVCVCVCVCVFLQLERKLVIRGEKIDELTEKLACERESSDKRLTELEAKLTQVTAYTRTHTLICAHTGVHTHTQTHTHTHTQVSSQCEEAGRERDEVNGKLSLLEKERWKLINEVTTVETKLKEVSKVVKIAIHSV